MTKQRIKTAGEKVAMAAKHAGKKIGEAAVVAGDLNDDGKIDQEDAKIAAAKAKVFASKAADGAGTLMEKAGARHGQGCRSGCWHWRLGGNASADHWPCRRSRCRCSCRGCQELEDPSQIPSGAQPKAAEVLCRRVRVETSQEEVHVFRRH
jgi:hypothetical protein